MGDPGRVSDDAIVVGSIRIPQSELVWRFSRSSGPGGQSVNTTDSRVRLEFDIAGSPSLPEHLRRRALDRLGSQLTAGRLVIVESEHRSQWQNRRAAQLRLSKLLTTATQAPPRRRRATRPTRSATERRLRAKKGRGRTKRLRRAVDDDLS
jgi:ribosome-associated protein